MQEHAEGKTVKSASFSAKDPYKPYVVKEANIVTKTFFKINMV